MKGKKMKKIVLKTAFVDEEIIPLLRWLNKLPGTFTEFSCAGHKNIKNDKPYVLLRCWNHSSLFYIMNFIAPFCKYIESNFGTKSYYNKIDVGQPRFNFQFENKKALKKCISKLPKINVDIYWGTT